MATRLQLLARIAAVGLLSERGKDLHQCIDCTRATNRTRAGEWGTGDDRSRRSGKTILGPIPAPGSCHLRYAGREPLPDPRCTPGAVDSAVTRANLNKTACRKGGYTATVRPPESVTNSIKRRLLAAYGVPVADIGKYELDHLVELSGGGSSDARNLWPEPNVLYTGSGSSFVHNDKDKVEAYLFHAQCAGKVSLAAIQQAVSQNWTTAVAVVGLPPIPTGYQG